MKGRRKGEGVIKGTRGGGSDEGTRGAGRGGGSDEGARGRRVVAEGDCM